jgi:hypothetical protein
MNWRDECENAYRSQHQGIVGPQSVVHASETRPSSISSVIESLDQYLKQLGECVRHLESIRDRVTGSRPQEVKAGENVMDRDKVPHSLISSINMRRNELVSWVKALEAVTHDLEQSI